MSAPGARRNVGRAATFAVIALAAVIAVRNATVYPAIAGYDAAEAIEYAEGSFATAGFPTTGSYYTPPGFFAIGGVAIELGEALGLDHPERVGQVFNALVAVATLFLLLALVRLLWPGRQVLHLAAIVFFVACPVVMKSAAMFHPEPLSMLLSTGSRLVLAARIARPLRLPPARCSSGSASRSASRSSSVPGRSGRSASSSSCSPSRPRCCSRRLALRLARGYDAIANVARRDPRPASCAASAAESGVRHTPPSSGCRTLRRAVDAAGWVLRRRRASSSRRRVGPSSRPRFSSHRVHRA